MHLGFCRVLKVGGHVGKEVEAGKPFDIINAHVLPGSSVLVVQKISRPDCPSGVIAGIRHLHDALEVLCRHCALHAALVLSGPVARAEDRASYDKEHRAPGTGVSNLLDISFQRCPYASVEAADLRSHVGVVGRLLGLLSRRPAVVGGRLMSAGIGAALLVAGRQIRLPGCIDTGIRTPIVVTRNQPGITVVVHHKGHPQRSVLCPIVEKGIVTQCTAIVRERVGNDFLVRIGRGVRMVRCCTIGLCASGMR